MTLQEKLQNLLMAADSLRQTAHLPETIRNNMYDLSRQIAEVDSNIVKIAKEIAAASVPIKNDDNIPF